MGRHVGTRKLWLVLVLAAMVFPALAGVQILLKDAEASATDPKNRIEVTKPPKKPGTVIITATAPHPVGSNSATLNITLADLPMTKADKAKAITKAINEQMGNFHAVQPSAPNDNEVNVFAGQPGDTPILPASTITIASGKTGERDKLHRSIIGPPTKGLGRIVGPIDGDGVIYIGTESYVAEVPTLGYTNIADLRLAIVQDLNGNGVAASVLANGTIEFDVAGDAGWIELGSTDSEIDVQLLAFDD